MASANQDTPTVNAPLPASDSGVDGGRRKLPLALRIVWSVEEPWHSGEVGYLPAEGKTWVVGRSQAAPGDGHPSLPFLRVRGAAVVLAEALGDPRLSRRQLLVSSTVDEVVVANVGRIPLRVNGELAEKATVREGDTLELEGRLLLAVVRVPWPGSDNAQPLATFAFGEPDEDGIVGESEEAWALRLRIRRVAAAQGHVLVTGGSGTGKELVSRAVHAHSTRAKQPLVARNAATFPEALVDAELFGSARNYPNAGMPERPGVIGAADGSTLLLDEIGELPLHVQPHLLRVLDRGEYQRLGDATVRRANVRVVGATNRDQSALRPDLAARFVHEIVVPDLSARRGDIPLLLRHLLRTIVAGGDARAKGLMTDGPYGPEPRVSLRFVRRLMEAPFKTHVRELEAMVWKALDASDGGVLNLAAASRGAIKTKVSAPDAAASTQAISPDAARIQACLDRHNGAIEPAWRELGLSSRYALRRLIAKHGIELRKQPRPKR